MHRPTCFCFKCPRPINSLRCIDVSFYKKKNLRFVALNHYLCKSLHYSKIMSAFELKTKIVSLPRQIGCSLSHKTASDWFPRTHCMTFWPIKTKPVLHSNDAVDPNSGKLSLTFLKPLSGTFNVSLLQLPLVTVMNGIM